MLCEKCKKRKASVFFFENGATRQLCQSCATSRTATTESVNPQSPLRELSVPTELKKYQSSLSMFDSLTYIQGTVSFKCKSCGSDIQDIKTRHAGCPECVTLLCEQGLIYNLPILTKPSRIPRAFRKKQQIQKQISELKQKIGTAIASEDYETAASLRDKIRALETEL